MKKKIEIQENVPLSEHTTFRIGGPARYFTKVQSEQELIAALEFQAEKDLDVLVLGGGSNMLVSDRGFDGLALHVQMRGVGIIEEDAESAVVRVGAGEAWDDAVQFAVSHELWGLENLSLIPGSAGAAAVQNIGAYNQQAGDTIQEIEVFDRKESMAKTLSREECGFEYRKSIFNSSARGRYVILHTSFRLAKNGKPKIDYPEAAQFFEEKGIAEPTLAQVRDAIVHMRRHKLPDPIDCGSAGCFFKNVYMNESEFEQLMLRMKDHFSDEDIVALDALRKKFTKDGEVMVPTGFLIDKAGLIGEQVGGAKIFESQAMIIVNESGKASADDVLSLAQKVRSEIFQKTGLEIDTEPELVGFTGEEIANFRKIPK